LGIDTVFGGDGDDLLFGNIGNDILDGGTGSDTLAGGKDNDIFTGGAGNDFLSGDLGNDRLVGADPTATNPGIGEIDTLTGGFGADIFVLGDGRLAYYNDANDVGAGLNDYALIVDFEVSDDILVLRGSASNYLLLTSPLANAPGTAIFQTSAGENELIAIVQGADSLNLDADYFTFL
jgi:Ca2+-binding RTX toxin-like protein